MTRVATGSTIDFGVSHGWPVGELIVTAGNQWKTEVEKTDTSRMPVTNSGTPASASRIVWITVSGRLRRKCEEIIAMPKASGIITRAESSTSASVLTTLSETCPQTGCW